jgi:hypothetical protein
MMRVLIVLSLAGVTAYMLIPPGEREWNAVEDISTARPNAPSQARLPEADRKLRSWGPTLRSLGRDNQGSVAAAQPASTPPLMREPLHQPGSVAGSEAPRAAPDSLVRPVAATALPAEPAQDAEDAAHLAWVTVVHGAKAHSAASISSPVTKFYPPGKELQILGRENGWIELLDPTTQERGYVFEQYLVAIDRPSPTLAHPASALMQASAEQPAKIGAAKPQKPRFASRPVRQAIHEVRPEESALTASKRDRTARREDRRERKFFRFFGGRDPGMEAWTVGSSR